MSLLHTHVHAEHIQNIKSKMYVADCNLQLFPIIFFEMAKNRYFSIHMPVWL